MPDKQSLLPRALGYALALLAWTATAHAAEDCPAAPLCGSSTPQACLQLTGSPVTLSPSKHYFQGFKANQKMNFLVGLTPEYLCHVSQPTREGEYCTLKNHVARFKEMSTNRNNVFRLETIFNHSPGWMTVCNTPAHPDACPGLPVKACCGTVFDHEQPFHYITSKNKWCLNRPASKGSSTLTADLDCQYLANLEQVVCDAYLKDIAVEVSLFNVWDGRWGTSPFNSDNTAPVNGKAQGFTAKGNFMTLSGSQQDTEARNAQKAAVKEIVKRLMKYPNVIWEVANEPDLIPEVGKDPDLINPPTVAEVFAWQIEMVKEIINNDSPKGTPKKAAHLIELEGFTDTSINGLDYRVDIETSHYTEMGSYTEQGVSKPRHGALELLQGKYSTITSPIGRAIGFNENTTIPSRTAADVRAEAWEFALGGGALFNGYSTDYDDGEVVKLRGQLKLLSDFMNKPGTVQLGLKSLDDMRQTSCKDIVHCIETDWFKGVPERNALDEGSCTNTNAKAYWSALKTNTEYALYIHHGTIVHPDFGAYRAISCGNGGSRGYQLTNFYYKVEKTGCYLEWTVDPETGMDKLKTHRSLTRGIWYKAKIAAKRYKQDLLIFLSLDPAGQNCVDNPAASFAFNCDHLSCNFDASGSTSSGSYVWDWGDGSSSSTANTSQSHVYANPGSYNVKLTVGNLPDDSGSTTQVVTAVSQAPTPSFFVNCNSLSCTFNAAGSQGGSGPIGSWDWSFGDGSSGSGVTATHTYPIGGSYQVTLTVTDIYNVMASLTQTIQVTGPPPVASFLFICSRLACDFDASATTAGNPITSYTWSFGDNSSGDSMPVVSHAYFTGGAYTVTLKVTDLWGQQSSTSKKVSVTDEIPVAAESFFTVPPCRIADTRTTTPLASGVQRAFQVTGLCGIPASAKAVSFNVTVVSPTGPGHFVIGNPAFGPFAHAAINFDPANSPRANNAILRLGTGSINIYPYVAASPGQVHVIVDVYGYFSEDSTPAPGAQGPFGFQTLTPCRLADTRTGTPIAVNTTRNFTVQGVCAVPANAAAAALNLTIISPTAGGHASLFQAGPLPPVPAINFNAGAVLANGARIRLASTTPDVSINYYSPIGGASTHALIDVFGYFKTDAPLRYRPITPCRAVDTRFADQGGPAALGAPETRKFQIRGNCGIPTSAKAVAVNITSVGSSGQGFLLAYPSDITMPPASYLNFDPGQGALGNGGIVALSTLPNDLAVTTANSTHVIIDVFGYFQ
jgi:PKD repeat protein